jgi:sugar phosphate isomerase/epimerase
VRSASELGLCLELSVRDPRALDTPDLLRRLAVASVKVSAVATGQAFTADGLHLSAVDDETRTAAVERFATQAALAAILAAPVILGGLRGRIDGSSGKERERRRTLMVESIRACADAAASAGAEVLLEPVNRYETDFVGTAEEGVALLDEVGSSGLRLLLDSFHMNIEERDPALAIRAAGDRLGYVHLADSNRHAPGEGHIDFTAIFGALAEIDYAGPLVAEILPLPDDLTAARHAAAFIAKAVRAADHPLPFESPG